MDYELSKGQKYVAFFVLEIFFWGAFLLLGFAGWIPGFQLLAGLIALLNILIGVAGYYVTRDEADLYGFQTTTKRQLTEEEARVLAEYLLVYKYGFRPARTEAGIDPAVSSSDSKEDAVRLFKYEFEPLNMSGRATLFIDLEQDLSVDVEDLDSLEGAASKIQNKGVVKSWMNADYEKAVQEKKESLGRSVDPTITVTRTDEGTEIREMPAGVQNQNKSNTDSAGAES